jgi:integrase
MSTLRKHVNEYLAMRRSLGFKLTDHGQTLPQFVDWLDHAGTTVITADLALAWAQSKPTSSPFRERQRLAVVRRFAEYMHAIDPRTEVPAQGLLPARQRRTAPYFYREAEVRSLMSAARSLSPPLKAATYETLIGLLACTGLRFGEAVGLDRNDVNLTGGSLLVHGKNGRARHVPIHSTTVTALAAYERRRDLLRPLPGSSRFFVTTRGGKLPVRTVEGVFAQLRQLAGLDMRGRGRSPRLHDLRHSFVIRTMLGWYRDGVDVQSRLPLLSTYLGHVDPKSTYWYQEAAPELLALAACRLEPDSGSEP